MKDINFILFLGFCGLVLTGCPSPTAEDLLNGQGGVSGAQGKAEEQRQYEAFFNPSRDNKFTVTISRTQWDKMTSDMLAYEIEYPSGSNKYRVGSYYPVDLTYEGPEGTLTFEQVGLRTRGNTTRVLPEYPLGTFNTPHFNLKFNETFDLSPGTTDYIAREDRKLLSLRSVTLKHSEVFNEVYAYNFMNSIGLVSPKAGVAHLIVNIKETNEDITTAVDTYYGMIEAVNKDFLQRHWGKDDEGDLYKALYQSGGQATLEDLQSSIDGNYLNPQGNKLGVKDWVHNYRPSYALETNEEVLPRNHTALKNFTHQLATLSGASLKTWLDANFEIQNFLKWMAANLMIGMPDDYRAMGNNFYMYFPKDGKASFIPYDYDHSFSKGWHPYDTENVGIFSVPTSDQFASPFGNGTRPLVTKVLAIQSYKDAYVGYLKKMAQSTFTYANYLEHHEKLRSVVGSGLAENPGVEGYFISRIAKTSEDIFSYEGTATTTVAIQRTNGFVQNGSVYGISIPDYNSPPNITVGATATGATPGSMKFTLVANGILESSSTNLTLTDNTAPFSAQFQVIGPAATYSVTATAYSGTNATGNVLGLTTNSTLGRSYYNDYTSVVNEGGGKFIFRFKPAHLGYGAGVPLTVGLRGNISGGNGWGADTTMTDDGNGLWEATNISASPGQLYKFVIDGVDWYPDLHNVVNGGSPDNNSIVP